MATARSASTNTTSNTTPPISEPMGAWQHHPARFGQQHFDAPGLLAGERHPQQRDVHLTVGAP
ncbi:hypothetical protein, partial [Nocardia cyriacigeorgica]|uniref:hypothetical protein n=1 Tax=Nocardia cyriacigeorgica TaxID=135487 RepID=UPI0024573675